MKIHLHMSSGTTFDYEREPMAKERFAMIMNVAYILASCGMANLFFAILVGAFGR